jgi:hypothetical protein
MRRSLRHIEVFRPTPMTTLLRKIQRTLFQTQYPVWVLLLRALGYECRNFLHRIGSVWRSPIFREGLKIGPEYHSIPWEDFQPCNRILACSADIRWLYTVRPWITLADAEIFLGGWKRGAASPSCMMCTERAGIQQASSPSMAAEAHSERLNRSR